MHNKTGFWIGIFWCVAVLGSYYWLNNTYYIDVSYTGSYAPAYNMGGFITKD